MQRIFIETTKYLSSVAAIVLRLEVKNYEPTVFPRHSISAPDCGTAPHQFWVALCCMTASCYARPLTVSALIINYGSYQVISINDPPLVGWWALEG